MMPLAGVPASGIFSAADMFADPQYAARAMLERATLPRISKIRTNLVQFSLPEP